MTGCYETLEISEEDFDFRLETILSFLSLVHPYLDDPDYTDTCVELRPILREGRSFPLSRSLILWDLTERSVERLRGFLERLNGYPACLFYSVYSFDNHKRVLSKTGSYTKGRIHSENAKFTCEIALDFDGIGEKEQQRIQKSLADAGIFPVWTFSGHGYQAHILLNEKFYDTGGLKTFVDAFRNKGFPVDANCIDPARLMRLPFTYNCKGFAQEEHPERNKPILCEIEQYSDVRYSPSELLFLIDRLPILYPKTEKINKKSPVHQKPLADDETELTTPKYPYIENYNIPEPIFKMLTKTPEGYRNLVLGFLIRYLKKHLFMSKDQIFEILSIWRKSACTPELSKASFEDDFKRLYYSYNGLPYGADLAKKFGYIPFDHEIVISKKEIAISNHFFQDFTFLNGRHIRMYLAIRLLEHMDEKPTQEAIGKLLKLSVRSVRTTIKELLKTRHCYCVKGNPKARIPGSYHSNKLYPDGTGYSVFSYNDLKCYVKELFEDKKRGNNELKLYLYMQYRFRNREIFMSQHNLGEALGLEQNSISEIASRLAEKGFMQIEKRQHESQLHFEKCYYTLLR